MLCPMPSHVCTNTHHICVHMRGQGRGSKVQCLLENCYLQPPNTAVTNKGSSGYTRLQSALKDPSRTLLASSEFPALACFQKKFLISGVTIFTHSLTCRPGCSKVAEDTTPDRR